ncbi:MAG: hypothetical protein IKL08_01280 [Clostridia bacterium]|nr:hypothetical protein [Clostridia bacterium]
MAENQEILNISRTVCYMLCEVILNEIIILNERILDIVIDKTDASFNN